MLPSYSRATLSLTHSITYQNNENVLYLEFGSDMSNLNLILNVKNYSNIMYIISKALALILLHFYLGQGGPTVFFLWTKNSFPVGPKS
jgi:hypothetical protein